VTVLELAVEQLPPEHVLALVVVTDRRQGPAWAEVARRASAIAMRIRVMSTSVGWESIHRSTDRHRAGHLGKRVMGRIGPLRVSTIARRP
jgi:hypothetical protein